MSVNGFELVRQTISSDTRSGTSSQLTSKLGLGNERASWDATCICLDGSSDKPDGNCHEIGYIISVAFPSIQKRWGSHPPGFTLTYRQGDRPEILKFSTHQNYRDRWAGRTLRHWPKGLVLSEAGEIPAEKQELLPSDSKDTIISAEPTSEQAAPYPTAIIYNDAVTLTSSSPDSVPTLGLEFISSTQTIKVTAVTRTEDAPPVSTTFTQDQYRSSTTTGSHLRVQGSGPIAKLFQGFEEIEHKAKSAAHAFVHTFHDFTICKDHQVPFHRPITKSKIKVTPAMRKAKSSLTISPQATSITTTFGTTSHRPSYEMSTLQRAARLPLGVKIASFIVVLLTLSSVIFALIVRDPRRRAEILAKCEERENKRLYRKAVRRQYWRNFFNRLRGIKPSPPSYSHSHSASHHRDAINWIEWNEKRINSLSNDATTSAMREELHSLRKTHALVDGIIHAEEGRHRTAGTYQQQKSIHIRRSERRARRYSRAESEKTAPPPYDEKSYMAVEEMRYTPQRPDTTPDSSVVSTSPRTSVFLASSDSASDSEKD